MPDDELKTEARATDRLTLFSDAVVAIAITLLAIDLPVPEGHTVSEFRASVPARRHPLRGLPDQLLRDRRGVAGPPRHLPVRQAGRLPAADAQHLLAADDRAEPVRDEAAHRAGNPDLDTHALRFGFYALLQVLESATVFAMLAHMLSHGLAPRTPRTMAIDIARQSFNLILSFGLSIPVFFVTPNAWVMWIVVPLLVSRWRHIRRRRRDREAGPPPGDAAPGDTGPGDTRAG